MAFLRALMVFDSQLLQFVFSSVNRLFLRRLINSSEKLFYLVLRREKLCEKARVCHVGGQSTSAKHVSGDFFVCVFVSLN